MHLKQQRDSNVSPKTKQKKTMGPNHGSNVQQMKNNFQLNNQSQIQSMDSKWNNTKHPQKWN